MRITSLDYITVSFIALFTLLTFCSYSQTTSGYELRSPDKKTAISFTTSNTGRLKYKMDFDGRAVTDWSRLGLQTDGPDIFDGIVIDGVTKGTHKETFAWPLGENSSIENNYNELIIHCHSSNARFDLISRVYNGSFAFRYVCRNIPGRVKLKKEDTEFNLAHDFTIFQYHEESIFSPTKLNELTRTSDLPSTLVSDSHLYVSIGEAENRNYTKCVLVKGSIPNSLAMTFYIDTIYRSGRVQAVHKDTLVTFKDSIVTPWRTISCATSAVGLHEFSQLNLKLVSPAGKMPEGIKPGKVFRVQINTQNALDGVDFAVKMNFQYIMLDAGWYGAEFRTVSDPMKPISGLDLPQILSYAKSKNIGVILYVNYVGLKAKLDTILPLYKQWGVSGIKFGFVDGGTQNGISWLDTAMKKVNDYGFVLNVHDHYKPTGLSRRYPFNLSQEGIRGDENSPDAFHTMTLPYTRFIAGAADFTFCYPNPSNTFAKNLKVNKGHQLALTVIYFDPLQAIFWYGRSADYKDSADLEFFKNVPTVWDETHFLQGEIGESASVARRSGDTWFMGNATGFSAWQTSLNLGFLKKGITYIATIYEDDGKEGIAVRTIKVKSGDKLQVDLEPKCGQAIIFRPKK